MANYEFKIIIDGYAENGNKMLGFTNKFDGTAAELLAKMRANTIPGERYAEALVNGERFGNHDEFEEWCIENDLLD
jgi:hypothetical protein